MYQDKYQDYYLQEGDILLSHINSVSHLGKCAIYSNPTGKLIHGMNLLMLRANKKLILPKYLYYVLNSKQFKAQLPKITKKSVNQASMTVTDIGNINLQIEESIDQQQRIVDVLDKADEIRTKKRLANAKLDEFLKSTFISMFGDPVKNTKGYQIDLLKNISTIISGGTPSRQHKEYFGGNVPWVTTVALGKNYIDENDAQDFLTELGVQKSATHIIPKNSLLFGSRVGVGKTSVNLCDICTNQDILSITNIDSTEFNMTYIKKVLEQYTTYFERQKRGATIKGISAEVLKNIKIPFAPVDLQGKYLKIVEKVEAQKQKNEQIIEQMDNLFNSLSQQAFKGELTKSNVVDLLTRQVALHSKIIDKCNIHQTFGAVKLEKIFNLCDMIQELNLVPGGYYRKAAGPYVPEMRHAVEQELLQNDWVKITNQGNGKKVEYKKNANFVANKAVYNQIFDDKNQEIEKIIDYFYDKDTNYCEAFSTLYMCWNDLILEGKNPTKTEIIDEFKNHWAPEKQRFERIYLLEILSDMSNQ